MIGTELVQTLVQCVALSHRIKDHKRVSLLLLAAPESGKTTITTAAHCKHVCQVAVISGLSIQREVKEHPHTEYLLFNDLTAIRAMSHTASNLLIVLLNQFTQGEMGKIAFAGKDGGAIERAIGIIACLPFETFTDHRSRWKELGFVSRMIPFSYSYSDEMVAKIKDHLEVDKVSRPKHATARIMPRVGKKPIAVRMNEKHTRMVRHIADARAKDLGQIGIRLLQNYHSLVRSHAVLQKREAVTTEDVHFLRAVDRFVSITECRELGNEGEDD